MIVGNVMATDITFVPSDFTATDNKDYSLTKDGVTVAVTASTVNADQIRVFKGKTITISSAVGNITKAVFTCTAEGTDKYGPGCFDDATEGSYSYDGRTGTWMGDAAEFTLTAKTNQVRMTSIVVTVDGTAVTVAAPSISGTTPFVGSTEVTITNNEEGAKVYYTTDGNDPTASSTEYTAAFSITETTTVKAIAIKGDVSSTVASKTFTAVPSVANVAALNALENNATFAFTGEALVVYVSGKYAYIKDDTGSSLIYGDAAKLANLAIGKKVAANWTGKVSIYNNLFEAVPDAVLDVTEDAAVEVTYPEAAITDVKAENMNQVVVLKDVTYTFPDGKNFDITKEGIDIVVPGYNQFGLEIARPVEGGVYDITGVISVYKENVQFQPINFVLTKKDVLLAVEPGSDISTVLEAELAGAEAKSIEIILAVGDFTITKPIICAGNVDISGSKPSTIDASALEGPMIQMPDAAPTEITKIDNINISELTIKGLKQALFYSSQKNYDIAQFNIIDCVIELAANATTIDFTKGSAARNINVLNSTIYAPTATTSSFYSSQGGQKMTELDANAIQTFTFKGNTMYNLAKSKNFFSHRQSNQKWLAYDAENNIFVNCGKSGQTIKGMNGGQGGVNPAWTIVGNAFNFDGADTSANEETGDADEPVKDSVAGTIAFTDAANGDFNGSFTLAEGATKPDALGDGRWTITYVSTPTGISTAKAEQNEGVAYNVAGQMVTESYKGLVIKNGKKMIQK